MYLIAAFVVVWIALVLGGFMAVRALPPPRREPSASETPDSLAQEIRVILGVLTFLVAGILAFVLTAGIMWLTGPHGPL